MGFYYAREKKKFDAEWKKTAAWYEDIEKNAAVRLGTVLPSAQL